MDLSTEGATGLKPGVERSGTPGMLSRERDSAGSARTMPDFGIWVEEEVRRAGHPERRQSSRPLRRWRIRLEEKLRDRLRSENARSQWAMGAYGVSSLVPFT